MGFVLAAAAAGAALPAALYGLRYQTLRQKKRRGEPLTGEEQKRQRKNVVLFVLCLLVVYALGFASINCFW